jgi:hypothetical protein
MGNNDSNRQTGMKDPQQPKGNEGNDHNDLARENLGNEPEETQQGDPDSPYKLKRTLDDKRPEDSGIRKGWNVDSNTSRGPQDLQTDDSDNQPSNNS